MKKCENMECRGNRNGYFSYQAETEKCFNLKKLQIKA